MKHLIWISIFSLLGLTACQNDAGTSGEQTTEQAADNNTVANTAPASAESAVGDAPRQAQTGSFLPARTPDSSPVVDILLKDFWVFEYYVVDDPAMRAANKGLWFNFYPDGTFESGHWQEKAGYGSWSLRNEEGKRVLYLDNIVDALDGVWEVQGINKEQDTMTWVGMKNSNYAGAITKVINLLTRPTKAQFGVEE